VDRLERAARGLRQSVQGRTLDAGSRSAVEEVRAWSGIACSVMSEANLGLGFGSKLGCVGSVGDNI